VSQRRIGDSTPLKDVLERRH